MSSVTSQIAFLIDTMLVATHPEAVAILHMELRARRPEAYHALVLELLAMADVPDAARYIRMAGIA